MTPRRPQMIAALQRSGTSERTQPSYGREVRLRAQFYRKSPDLISAQELQRYLRHRKNIDGLSPRSTRLCYSGIRFFYHHVLGRAWKTLDLIRAASAHRLPALVSLEEVHRLLHAAPPCTIGSTAPPSSAVGGACTKRLPCR
jgi:integrase/recombinase XerD